MPTQSKGDDGNEKEHRKGEKPEAEEAKAETEEGEEEQAEVVQVEKLIPKPEEVDPESVAKHLVELGRIYFDNVKKAFVETGDYLLEKVFHGDPDEVRSKSPGKHATFTAIAEKCDSMQLPWGKSWLHAAVQAACIRQELKELPGSNSYQLLPHSYQVELARVRDADKAESLAQEICQHPEQFTIRDVRDLVDQKKPKSKTQTTVNPAWTAIRRLLRTYENAVGHQKTGHALPTLKVDELPGKQFGWAMSQVAGLFNQLQGLYTSFQAEQQRRANELAKVKTEQAEAKARVQAEKEKAKAEAKAAKDKARAEARAQAKEAKKAAKAAKAAARAEAKAAAKAAKAAKRAKAAKNKGAKTVKPTPKAKATPSARATPARKPAKAKAPQKPVTSRKRKPDKK